MVSFKVKLVAYFLLLAVLPLGAAYWGFTRVAGQNESHRVDARLQSGLRSAGSVYDEQLDARQRAAAALAGNRAFQIALERHRVAAARALLRGRPGLSLSAPAGPAGTRRVEVLVGRRLVGTVVASVPLDARLASVLRAHAGLVQGDVLAFLRGTSIVAASSPLTGSVALAPGRTATVSVGGDRYRAVVAPAAPDAGGIRFATLTPQARIDAANGGSRDRLLLGLLVSLAVVALVAYLEGRTIVRSLRSLADAANAIAHGRLHERVQVRGHDELAQLGTAFNDMATELQARLADLEAERERLRDAVTRFGEALAATHDSDQLLRVIVEAAQEGVGAAGAELRAAGGIVVRSGDPDAEGERLELPLGAGREAFGTLRLVGDAFDEDERMTAASLASHAAIALENARLHRLVERQALVDGLTGVANRRACEDALTAEIARAERLGTPLTLVLADLDDFKAINDVHGHAVGDDVLREFAAVLRATLRDSDLAGRWGGEEFLLLLPGTDAVGGAQLADRVRGALRERAFAGAEGAVLRVTCSFGVAQQTAGERERDLFAAADRALYRAKRGGKDRVELDAPVRSF